MKNKRTFLASLALGIFLLATIAPAIAIEGQETGIKRKSVKTSSRA